MNTRGEFEVVGLFLAVLCLIAIFSFWPSIEAMIKGSGTAMAASVGTTPDTSGSSNAQQIIWGGVGALAVLAIYAEITKHQGKPSFGG